MSAEVISMKDFNKGVGEHCDNCGEPVDMEEYAVEKWEWAMKKTIEQDFPDAGTLEETIEAMDSVGRFDYSGHSPDIVVKAQKSKGKENEKQ